MPNLVGNIQEVGLEVALSGSSVYIESEPVVFLQPWSIIPGVAGTRPKSP